MTNTDSKNGIIYVRVSSHEQIDGTSLESQERVCKEYAQRENINVLEVFIEKGESAKTANRTEFIRAISFCSNKKNKVSSFIVYKIDRFSRNQTDYAIVKQKLQKYGTEIESVSEKIDNSPSGKLMEVMLSGFAEFDNNVRTERSIGGMKERIKQGIWVWQAPLGYLRLSQGSNLTPDPKIAPFIRLAFEQYAKGTYTYESLAEYLNKQGFTSRKGNKAIPQLIEKILKNPLYMGIIRVWDTETKASFEPLIDENLFYLCQSGGMNSRNVAHKKINDKFPLRKLVICKFCKASITGSASTGRKKIKYPYYHHHKQECSHSKFIPKETFEQFFVEYLNEITPSPEYEKVFKVIILDIWKNNCKNFTNQNDQIRKEIIELERQKQRIFELHQSKVYDDNDFLAQKEIVCKKIAEKDALIIEKHEEEFDMDEALEYCFNFIRNTAKTWLDFEKEPEKRLRFQKIIFPENIEFSGEKFGTTKLSPIYSLYQQYLVNPTTMVMYYYPLHELILNKMKANLTLDFCY